MSWKTARLDECTRIVGGATPASGVAENWDGDVLWATPKDLSDLASRYISDTPRKITRSGLAGCSAEVLPAGSVLFSSRAPIGHVAINTVPMATNQGFKSFVPNPKLVRADFLYWWLKSNRSYLESLGNGATFKEVSKGVVSRIEIPLPPLDEQRRIAAILDQADDLLRKRREALQSLSGLKQNLLRQFLDNPAISFSTVNLGDVCTRVTDGTHQAPEWADAGVPFIFVSNVRNGEISLETSKYVSFDTYRALTKNAPIEKGDVLYTAVGSYGHSAVVETSEPFLFQRHVAHLKPKPQNIRPEYLAALLESVAVRRQADTVAKGIAQKTVTLTDLKRFELKLPSVDKQREFSTQAAAIDELKSRQGGHLAALNALFTSLQHRAFNGEL